MSSNGQQVYIHFADQGAAVAVGSWPLRRGEGFDSHEHPVHQLAWAQSGVLTMGTAESTWVLPRSRALWMPAGVAHTTGAAVAGTLCSLYFRTNSCPIDWVVPTVVAVSPILGELITYLADRELSEGPRRRAESVVFDLLEPATSATLHARVPTDERARLVADALLADPADLRTLDEWGHAAGASTRTLARIFVDETGMSFSRWRTELRLAASLPLLADGVAVSTVARRVGYANPSAFIAAFRRAVGVSPRNYFPSEGSAAGRSSTG
jgi:AraC-like DNA-binding protein/quercetin dioxygenase-like cupin family protein